MRPTAGVRRPDRSMWHLTLRLLCSSPAAAVSEVLAAVESIFGHSFEATVTGFVELPRAT